MSLQARPPSPAQPPRDCREHRDGQARPRQAREAERRAAGLHRRSHPQHVQGPEPGQGRKEVTGKRRPIILQVERTFTFTKHSGSPCTIVFSNSQQGGHRHSQRRDMASRHLAIALCNEAFQSIHLAGERTSDRASGDHSQSVPVINVETLEHSTGESAPFGCNNARRLRARIPRSGTREGRERGRGNMSLPANYTHH